MAIDEDTTDKKTCFDKLDKHHTICGLKPSSL